MADDWFLFDGNAQHGPLARGELADRLETFENRDNVSVWRFGFQDWKPAEQVFDLGRSERLVAPYEAPTISYKRRYGLYGVCGGLGVCLADLVLKWRGEKFVAWQGDGIARNFGYIAGTVGTLWLVCFLVGLFRDGWKSKKPSESTLDPRNFTNLKPQPELPKKTGRYNNFIARNWRGEYSLVTAYWGFGFLGNILVGIVPVVAIAAFQSKGGYDPRAILATLVSIWVGVLAIVTWQLVGVWRTANRHIAARVMSGKTSPWARLAKLGVFLGTLRLMGTFVSTGLPQLAETSRMAFLGDPNIPAYSIRVMRNGTEAEITGGFKYGLTDDFVKILNASRQIKVVHLDSVGGRIGEAIKLNSLIRERKFDTYVSAICLSACTIAFAGGRKRILRTGAKLGFHAPAFPGLSAGELAEAAKDQKAIFAAAGFSKAFVDRALSTPSSELWEPSADVLLQAGAITTTSDGSEYAMSGFGPNPNKEHIGDLLTKWLPVLQALKVRFPGEYDAAVQAYYDSFVDGKTENEATLAVRAKLIGTITTLRPLADDAVLIDVGNVYADQYSALGAKNPALCYQYASGVGNRVSASDIPNELVKRENEVNKRIVETAAKRPATPESVSDALWKKIGAKLQAKGIAEVQFDLIGSRSVSPERYVEYCSVAVLLFREISKLPQNEAGILLRQLLSEK